MTITNLRIMHKLFHTREQLRKYAYERSPFYQRLHKGLVDRPLHELPVLTKSMMMKNFAALVTDRTLHLEDIRAFADHGDVGHPSLRIPESQPLAKTVEQLNEWLAEQINKSLLVDGAQVPYVRI